MAISYVNGYFQLVLDGVEVGIVQKAGGGEIKADVAKYALSTEYLVKNHIGNVSYGDMNVQCGVSMGASFKDWIQKSLDSAHAYMNGSIVVANYNREAVQEREFKNALITEVAFPNPDAAAKDAAYITVKWACETIRWKKGGGEKISKPSNTKQQLFKQENFRFTMDGFDKVNASVNKIELPVWKQTVQRDQIGDARDYQLIPGKIEFTDLKITFAEAVVDQMSAWHQSFIIDGNCGIEQEKTWLLEYLDPTRQKVLLALEGKGCGITNLTRGDMTNNEDKRATAEVTCYTDQVVVKSWEA